MNILFLGATGYLGSHLLSIINKDNRIFTVSRKKTDRKEENIFNYPLENYVQVLKEHRIDKMINCIGVYQKENNEKILEGNLMYPLQVIDKAVEFGVKNIVNINTSLPEELNLYSFTKKELGRFGRFYSQQYDINFYNLLVEMFYGPDEPKERFFPSIINRMIKGDDIELTEGRQIRDIIRVEDVCEAVRTVMESSLKGYYDIPVGTGEGHSVRETVELLHQQIKSHSRLFFGAVPMRQNEPDCIADISLLSKLGFSPAFTWRRGLEDMVSEENINNIFNISRNDILQ